MASNLPRILGQHCGYFGFATITLAVAVGANLIVFTVVNALWLRPLPFPEADRLVAVTSHIFVSLKAPALAAFESVAGQVSTYGNMEGLRPSIRFQQVARDVETIGVTPEYFRLFDIPIRGRDFNPDDDRVGAEPVAIVSHRLWSREFGGRPEVIGALVSAKPLALRVIGIAPPHFEGARRGERVDVWIPSNLVPRIAPVAATPGLMVYARLPRGQSAAEISRRLLITPVNERDMSGLSILPLDDAFATVDSRTIVIREGGTLLVTGGLAMLVLLGGAATLSALVLVHYERRRHDQAVKLALGASPAHLVRELATELGLVGVAGTTGAIFIVVWGLHVIPSLSLPGGVDMGRLDLSVDWRVFGAAIIATLLTLAVAAWLPLKRTIRVHLASEFARGSGPTSSVSSHRLRQWLLGVHSFATIVVLIAAGLFVRAVAHGFGSGPAFDADRTLFVSVQVISPTSGAFSASSRLQMIAERTDRVDEALRSVPGIKAIAAGTSPIGAQPARMVLTPMVVRTGQLERQLALGRLAGSPELLATLGIPILVGRELTMSDASLDPSPAVVTASLAAELWPAENPLGQAFSISGRGSARHIVVGIARDFVFGSLARSAAGVIVTVNQTAMGGIEPKFVLKATNPQALVEPVRAAVQQAVPGASWVKVATGREVVAADMGQQRLGAVFFSGFGLVALLLGIGGVFGLVAYQTETRQREFGIRLALGATPRALLLRSLAAGLVPVSIGTAIGLVVAGWVARLFGSMLIGLSPVDPLTYATVGLTTLVAAALASLVAAWRLRHIVPMKSLRSS
jgi:putative ABC transport system permease protein